MKCAKKECLGEPTHFVVWPTGRMTAACDECAAAIKAVGCGSGHQIHVQRFEIDAQPTAH